jgi:hypothetical protein
MRKSSGRRRRAVRMAPRLYGKRLSPALRFLAKTARWLCETPRGLRRIIPQSE